MIKRRIMAQALRIRIDKHFMYPMSPNFWNSRHDHIHPPEPGYSSSYTRVEWLERFEGDPHMVVRRICLRYLVRNRYRSEDGWETGCWLRLCAARP